MVTQVAAFLLALTPVAWADPSCVVHGMAYSQENMAKTPNGAFLAGASSCQNSCRLTVYCHYFTWYNDSTACWLFGDQATLVAKANATSGPRSCTAETATPTPEPAVAPVEPVVPATVAPVETVETNATMAKLLEEKFKEVVKKAGHLASVIKAKTTDPNVTLNADKVIRAAQVGTLPEREAVYSVFNEASATLPLEEAEKEGIVVTAGDLDVINKVQHFSSLEPAEEGVSYGVGAPWTDAVVPYCFRPGISYSSMQNVQRAVAIIQQLVPGIKFKLLGTKGQACEESPSILATDVEQGCFSDIGMKSQLLGGSQTLNVPSVCTLGVVLHELLHALGMAHEQARPDRDNYIRVMWQNIRPGMEGQFQTNGAADTARPYDLTSIMHYGQTAFTKNGQPTFLLTSQGQAALRSSGASSVGQRETLSQLDFEQLVHLYNCQRDAMGRYSECSPVPSGPDLLVILLGVLGGLAACGCGLAVAYWYCGRQMMGKKRVAGEVRPLITTHRGGPQRPVVFR